MKKLILLGLISGFIGILLDTGCQGSENDKKTSEKKSEANREIAPEKISEANRTILNSSEEFSKMSEPQLMQVFDALVDVLTKDRDPREVFKDACKWSYDKKNNKFNQEFLKKCLEEVEDLSPDQVGIRIKNALEKSNAPLEGRVKLVSFLEYLKKPNICLVALGNWGTLHLLKAQYLPEDKAKIPTTVYKVFKEFLTPKLNAVAGDHDVDSLVQDIMELIDRVDWDIIQKP